MDTRSCAHCGGEFNPNHGKQKYCGKKCANAKWVENNSDKVAQSKRRWRQANPEKQEESRKQWRTANPDYKKNRYHGRTVPLGQRLQERLDNLFRTQAAVDPSGLPQLASRVLTWSPKGFSEPMTYALSPYSPLEADWLYYAEMTPEEAVVVYERED